MANKVTPKEQLEKIANENNVDLKAEEFAKLLDEKDDLKWCREEFCYPKNKTLPPSKLKTWLKLCVCVKHHQSTDSALCAPPPATR